MANLFLINSMKLRARQKERIARRRIAEVHSSAEGPESLNQSLVPDSKEVQYADPNTHSEDSSELDPTITPHESKYSQSFDAKISSYSTCKQRKISKHDKKRYHGSHLSFSVRSGVSSDIPLSSNDFQDSLANCVPSSSFLPVLGLCAPNASQRNSTNRRNSTPFGQPLCNHEQQRTSIGVREFPSVPFINGGSLTDTNVVGQEPTDLSILLDTPREARHRHLKNIIPDNYFPFGPVRPDLLVHYFFFHNCMWFDFNILCCYCMVEKL